jgi:hypothetical protein
MNTLKGKALMRPHCNKKLKRRGLQSAIQISETECSHLPQLPNKCCIPELKTTNPIHTFIANKDPEGGYSQ